MKNKNIFKGDKAILNYLSPGTLGPTPLVELPEQLNPYKKYGAHIYIKLIASVPLANIKSIPAWYMLKAIPKKELKNINDLVEYSSGNMALSLTILSRHFGIKNMHTIITPDVPKNKQNLLKLLGTDLIISSGPSCPDVRAQVGGVWEAMQMGKQPGWKNLGQYSNLNIPKGAGQQIGGEIFTQLGKNLDIFCAAIGTSGTVYGISSYLKKKIPKLYVIAASAKKGSSIPGPRSEEHVKKLHFPWEKTVDLELPVDTENAFKSSLEMIRQGIFVGPSSGMQLCATLEVLKKMKKEGRLKKSTNAVILGCDTMFPYIEEYFTVLTDILKK